jgi:hypothetical protein
MNRNYENYRDNFYLLINDLDNIDDIDSLHDFLISSSLVHNIIIKEDYEKILKYVMLNDESTKIVDDDLQEEINNCYLEYVRRCLNNKINHLYNINEKDITDLTQKLNHLDFLVNCLIKNEVEFIKPYMLDASTDTDEFTQINYLDKINNLKIENAKLIKEVDYYHKKLENTEYVYYDYDAIKERNSKLNKDFFTFYECKESKFWV